MKKNETHPNTVLLEILDRLEEWEWSFRSRLMDVVVKLTERDLSVLMTECDNELRQRGHPLSSG